MIKCPASAGHFNLGGSMNNMKWGWKKDPEDVRDIPYKAVSLKLPQIANVVYLIKSPVKNQFDLGSCVFNGVVSEMESVMIQNDTIPPTVLSRLFAYWDYRNQYTNINEDTGAFPRDALKSIQKDGICLETSWPYNTDQWTTKPTDECWDEAKKYKIKSYHSIITLDDMLQSVAEGWPFGCGIYVHKSFMSDEVARTGKVPMPAPGEEMLGGHFVYFWGYDRNKRVFHGQNSWGIEWGKKGTFTIPFDYLTNKNLADDCWTIRTLEK